MSLSKQLIALVLTIKNKETKFYINPEWKRQTQKTPQLSKQTKPGFDALFTMSGQEMVWALFLQTHIALSQGLVCEMSPARVGKVYGI